MSPHLSFKLHNFPIVFSLAVYVGILSEDIFPTDLARPMSLAGWVLQGMLCAVSSVCPQAKEMLRLHALFVGLSVLFSSFPYKCCTMLFDAVSCGSAAVPRSFHLSFGPFLGISSRLCVCSPFSFRFGSSHRRLASTTCHQRTASLVLARQQVYHHSSPHTNIVRLCLLSFLPSRSQQSLWVFFSSNCALLWY